MGVTGTLQVEGFLYACGLGFLLGGIYEIFRTVHLLFPPSARGCFIQDVGFCLIATLLTFFGFLAIADGNLYPYLFIGEGIGFFAFYKTMGHFIHIVLSWIIGGILYVMKWLRQKFFIPLGKVLDALFEKLESFLLLLGQKIKKMCKKSKFFSKKT
jgi:hypothetical protein